jgi:SAM-dependent methyltransferase
MEKSSYIIRGGVEGRERLRVLARVMRPTSLAFLHRAGLKSGMTVLDVGSGGGDLAFDLAAIVGPTGNVVGTEIDQVKLDIARAEAKALNLANVEFQLGNIQQEAPAQRFDLIHARFILTHLTQPEKALANMMAALRPGGILAIEDIEFRGYISYPDCPAIWKYVAFYTDTVKRRGGDANIGPRLPTMLRAANFEGVDVNIVQPVGIEGEVKLISPLTMEAIADSVISEGLATREEVDQLVAELYEFARKPDTLGCMPRVFESSGRRPVLIP